MKTILIAVSVSPVSSSDNTGGTVNVRLPLIVDGVPQTSDELYNTAVARGVQKLYGRNCFWWTDSGLTGYGQVMRPCSTGGSSAVTYRAALDVSMPELPAVHERALEALAESDRAMYEEMDRDRNDGVSDALNGLPMNRSRSYDYQDGYKMGLDQDAASRLESIG